MILLLSLYCPETDVYFSFPFGEYNHTDDMVSGYNASIYSTVNLRSYYDQIRISVRKVLDMDLDSDSKTAYLLKNGEMTTTRMSFAWSKSSGVTRIYLYPEGSTQPYGGFLTVANKPDYFSNNRSLTITNDVRRIDKNNLSSFGSSLKVYEEYIGGPTGTKNICSNVIFYDRGTGYVDLRQLGGITALTADVIEHPGFTPRSSSGGVYALNGADGSDPLTSGGTSGPGGGEGYFDGTSDTITVPGLPALSAVDTGFISLYNPSLAQLRALASFMWSTDLIDNIRKAFSDPMDAILGLSIVPVAVPDGIQQNVRIGNVTSDIIMTTAASQYVTVDCGSLTIQEYWGSAMDYSPNTKAQLILPYIGAREIDVDEIMRKSVHIEYHVDILTGACVCFVSANGSVIYQFEGSCSNQIPITGSNWTQVLTTAVQVAGNAAAFVATAGGSGAVQASTAISGLANTAGNVMNSKPRIEHSGNVTGGGGQMSVQVPYLIVQRPRQSLPVNYNKYEGYPSNITAKLADLQGFTSVESIHLEGVNATDQELEEIQQLLRGGVII